MTIRFLDNLQVKVTLVFLLMSLAPLGIVSVFSVRTADRVIESMATNQLENVAAEKQDLLERWIIERKADLAVVAGSALVKGMDPAKIAPYLELVRTQYKVYQRFVIAGVDGRTVYDSAGAPGGTCAGEAWYRRALEGEAYMSEVSLELSAGQSVFRLSTPIRGPDGRPQGAACATVNTRTIAARVLSVDLGETGECYLVDKNGLFLAHKEPRRILKENIAQSESFTHIFGEARSRPIYTDYRGIAVLGASRSIANTQWYVVAEQDRDEAFASSYRLKRAIYVVIAVTVLGEIGLSWLLAYYITAPIRAVSEAAHVLARGDFENPLLKIRTNRRDEIGALHVAFQYMANQLWDQHNRLQQRVGLTEIELRKADAKLKSTLEAAARSEHLAALGRLASGVAHEIRTPLTSLKLYLQSVQEEIATSPEYYEDFEIAMQQVYRIERTINHFLDLARPQEPIMAAVDFSKLIDDALVVVQPRANQQDVEITKFIATDLPHIEGDSHQLGEVIVNLLVNALEAMPHGGKLTISVARDTAETDLMNRPWVRVEVSDTGRGIRQADIDQLFEPFFSTKASGSGLGLAIVQGTVQLHGGTVKVLTQPGEGTTFSIYLPATTA